MYGPPALAVAAAGVYDGTENRGSQIEADRGQAA
jgi:hypothetical protein